MAGLFAEINSGAFRLKHVTDDQKAYKQKKEDLGPVSFEDLERRKAEAEARRAEKERERPPPLRLLRRQLPQPLRRRLL